jgi:dTDP-4-dehydrorhamnose reductase
MSKKVLVFGGRGMAGHMIAMYLKSLNKYKAYNIVSKEELDENSIICYVLDIKKVEEIIDNISPQVIINCIGILNDKSDLNVLNTVFINSFFPKLLENIGYKKDIKIIHLSTDCVFSGSRGHYTEKDIKDETNMYGLSKNIGGIINKKDLTFRTSIIGPELK